MLRMLCLTLLLFTGFQVAAQDIIDETIARDPFDPDRGKEPEEPEEEEVVEEAPPPVEVKQVSFILDGTMMLGKTRYALVTYDDPNPEPAVEPEPNREDNRRRRPVRRSRVSRVPQKVQKTKMVKLNDKLLDYTLTAVDHNEVVFKRGLEEIRVSMFSGDKEDRGGSKEAKQGAPEIIQTIKENTPGKQGTPENPIIDKPVVKQITPVKKVDPKANPQGQNFDEFKDKVKSKF